MTADLASFPVVDAHHHLWDLGANRHPWLTEHIDQHFFLGDYAALRRDYLPADYRRDAAGLNVIKTVHCEAEWARDDQVGESRWLASVQRDHGMPDAVVAHAWFHTPNSREVMAAQSAFPMVRGIRSKPVTAPAADAPFPRGAGSLHDPRWIDGFRRLAEFGFSFDLRVPCWHLHEAAEVVAKAPEIPVVLNHTGFPWDRSDAGLARWREGMEAIAECANVHLKLSELGVPDAPWDYASNAEVVRTAVAIFGPERCMFASNFPVSGLRVGYRQLVEDLHHMLAHLGMPALRAIFHDTASRFYRL